jgi:SAM-dependent methyltransferase
VDDELQDDLAQRRAGPGMDGDVQPLASSAPLPETEAESLLTLRRNLANSAFLQQQIYTRDESKFAGSTYAYWIRLHRQHDSPDQLALFPAETPSQVRVELTRELRRKIFDRMPEVFSDLVKLSSRVPAEDSVRECLDERDRRLRQMPGSLPYAIYFCQLNRLIRRFDRQLDLTPNAEEADALLDHVSRQALKRARSRFPELWDEVQGHYVLDSRGAAFAKALAMALNERGYLAPGTRFVDVGSGTGTMVAAVGQYTEAHATGIERHEGVVRLAKAMVRRLRRKGCLPDWQIEFVTADVFGPHGLNLAEYDVLYVYSPIGRWEIDIDEVIARMRTGALLATSNRPRRNAAAVEELPPVAGLPCFRNDL